MGKKLIEINNNSKQDPQNEYRRTDVIENVIYVEMQEYV